MRESSIASEKALSQISDELFVYHTGQYKNSFFVRKAVDWNNLDNTTAGADCE